MVKLPATVTVRIPTFLVGDPLKRSFTCQCYWEGVHIPSYMILPQWANRNSYNQVVSYIHWTISRFAPEKWWVTLSLFVIHSSFSGFGKKKKTRKWLPPNGSLRWFLPSLRSHPSMASGNHSQELVGTHRIHGIGIYTYIWLTFYGKFVRNYTSPMEHMGWCCCCCCCCCFSILNARIIVNGVQKNLWIF